MGKQESESRERTRRYRLRMLILESLKLSGMVGLMFVAPNVIGTMAKLGIIPSPRHKSVINRTTHRLVKGGLLRWHDKKLVLTPRGEQHLRLLLLREGMSARPRRWDGKWRVLIFDIPERRRSLRIKLRITLRSLGFERLQDSVWVYPYDCEDLIALLKAEFKVGDDIRYIIADSIERDAALRKQFKLDPDVHRR